MPQVWIDTDMGFDDLAAILTVAAASDWPIAGLSLVAGNAPLDIVEGNAARSAALFAWTMPIHRGAAQPLVAELVTAQNILGANAMNSLARELPADGIALSQVSAFDALTRYLDQSPEPATILALGPLTNIAAVLQSRPGLAKKIGRLVWMGGSAVGGNHTAAAEFNAAVDPEAVQVVLDAGVALQMVGLDTCRQVRVFSSDVDALRAIGTERGDVLADLLGGYVAIGSAGVGAMYLYDPVAAAAMVLPACATFKPAYVVTELTGQHTRGMTVVEWRVPRRATANAEVATTVDEAAVRKVVLDALTQAAGTRAGLGDKQ